MASISGWPALPTAMGILPLDSILNFWHNLNQITILEVHMKGKIIIGVMTFVLGLSGVAAYTGLEVKTVENGLCLYAASAAPPAVEK